MQGEGQCRYVVWIISLALQIHWDPRVLLGDNKLVSKGSMKRGDGGLQQLYVFDFKQLKMIEFEENFLKGLSPF